LTEKRLDIAIEQYMDETEPPPDAPIVKELPGGGFSITAPWKSK